MCPTESTPAPLPLRPSPPLTLFAPGRLVSLICFLVLRRSVLAFDACSDRVFDAFRGSRPLNGAWTSSTVSSTSLLRQSVPSRSPDSAESGRDGELAT